jgi:hypothetical protein
MAAKPAYIQSQMSRHAEEITGALTDAASR